MKKKYEFSGKRFFVILLCLAFAINPSLGFCLPEGENVVSGQASFDRSQDNTLNINTPSENLIVNYDSFSIAQPEAVHFLQPSSSAIALNRVVGVDPSAIYGILTATGRIFLINPNGVLFGQGARVDAAGLVASTLDISNENFLAGNYNFFKNGLNSFIVNQGQITITNGGYAFLLSQGIDNQGSIKADLGKVVLASGEKITLALDDLNEISVVVDEAVKNEVFGASGEKIDSAVNNSGTIAADGGKVTLTAKALNTVFDYAINNTGVIQAKALVSNNGVVELLSEGAPIINIGKVAADGSIEAPNAGKVSIAGPEVLQQGQVTANAAEAGKAGEISIVSQDQTTLGTGSLTEAKALGLAGEGGSILIDSAAGDSVVNAGAVIDVSAGSDAGNAGRVEVSAFKVLDFSGIINGRAPLGYLGGVAILDPTDAIISGTLNANTTVWATNDITIDDTVIIDGDFTLNLFADHNSETAGDWEDGIGAILNPFDRRIEAADGADTTLNLKAGTGIGTDNPITTRKVHTLTAEINPNLGTGDINLVSDPANVSLRLAGLFTPSGNITVENRNNAPVILDSLDFNLFPFAVETLDGSVSITNVGSIDIPGTNGDGISATADISLVTTSGTADITAGSEFAIIAAQSFFGNVSFEAGNSIDLGQVFSADLLADSADITLTAGNNITLGNGSRASSTGNISFTADNNISLDVLEASGDVDLTALSGAISDNNLDDNNIIANSLVLTADTGIDLDTTVNSLDAIITGTGNLAIDEADDIILTTLDTIDGNIAVTAQGAITALDLMALDTDADGIGGNIFLTASVGDLSLGTLSADYTVDLTSSLGAITDNNLDANNVTANEIILSAPLGIDLDTQAAILSAATTDADITIREADDVAINTINAGTANVDLSSASGSITDNNLDANNITANSLVLTADTGMDLDTTVNALEAIVTGTGDLFIDEADAITLTALDILGGSINITAENTITAVDLLALDVNGNISLTANAGDILVDTLEAGNSIELTALLGSIVDDNSGLNNVTATNLIAQGANGIDLDIMVDTLSASTTDANITIREVDDVALNTVNAGIADVDLSSALGAITDNNGDLNNVSANTLTLTAETGIDFDTMVNSLDAIVSSTGNLLVDEADEIILTTLDVIDGNMVVTAGGSITANDLLASDANLDGTGGDISLSADSGDINVVMLFADNAIDLNAASGAISDNNLDDNNIIANSLVLTADTGIDLDTTVNSLDAIVTGTGDLAIDELDEISLIVDVINGDINLNAGGTITANDLMALDTDADGIGGNIFLTASVGDLSLGTLSADYTVDLTSSLGAITDNNLDANNVTANEIILSAPLGIDLDTQAAILSAATTDADITIREADDVAINTINAGTANVDLSSASGSITDNNDIDNNITANNLVLTANSGADLDTDVATLDAMITGNGDLAIEEFDAIELISLDLVGGSADITAGSSIAADSLLNLDSDGNIILTALTGDITIGSIEAGGSIILTAALGAINEIGLGDADVDLSASIVDLSAQEEIGSALDELDIETDADILIAESTNAKDIVITEANDVAIETITTGGDVYLSSLLGSITDANADLTTNITADNLFLTAADDVDLDTDVSILDAIIGDNLTIREADDVSLYAIDVLGGNVNISAGNILTITDSLLTNGGNLILSAANGIMQEQLGDIDTTAGEGIGAGSYTANADSDNDYTGTYTLASGGSIYTQDIDGSGEVEITAADIDLGSGSLIAAGDRDVTLLPSFDGITPLTIGLGNAAGDFTLNNDELDSILTSGTVIIGDDNSGNIVLDGVMPASFFDLELITGGNINDIDADIAVTISNLILNAGTGIGTITPLNIDVDSLSASTEEGNIFIDEANDVELGELTSPESIQLNANGQIQDGNADLTNINTLDLFITAGNGIGEAEDAIETEIETLDAYAANGGIYIDEADDLSLNLVNAEDDDVELSAGGSILDNDLGAAPDDFDILGANITLDVGGHIGSSGEEEEVDLDLDTLISLAGNFRPDAPTGLDSSSHTQGAWSNNNLVDVFWTRAINPNYYTGSDESIAGYSFVWDTAADTTPDEIQDIGDITFIDDNLLADGSSIFLHIRSINNIGNWSEAIHLGPFQIDTVAPVISASRNIAPNINGWNNSDITVSFEGIDELSGVASITAPILLSLEGLNQSATGTIIDLAGNSASITESGISIDKTVPVISAGRDILANANGWNNSDITVSFAGADELSGVDSITGPILINTEGLNQSVIGTIIDLAGNSASITESGISVDKTAPVISAGRNIAPNINGWNNSDIIVNFAGSDSLSGVESITVPILLSLEGLNQSATGTIIDLAGNSASITESGISIDKTAPVISAGRDILANANGWNNSDITVSFAGADELSGVDSITGPILINTEGLNQSVIGTIIDLAGNSASITESGISIDKTVPVISAGRDILANANGWNNSDITVSFAGADELSGVDNITAPIIISSEGEGQSVIGIVTDLAGNLASIIEAGINIDKTSPTISAGRDILANANGWNNSDITVSFAGADELSGVDSITGPILINTEGLNQSVIGTIIDLAGNSASITESGISIDKTLPVISAARNIGSNINGFNNSDVTVSFSGTDDLSGVASITAPILVSSEGINLSVAGTITDLAGNSAQVTESGINIDKTAPTISITQPLDGAVVANQQVLSFGVSDLLSGVDIDSITGPANGTVFNTDGTHSFSITALDLAGNISQEIRSFTITTDFLESQISNATTLNPFFFANPQTTGQFRLNSFDAVGPVFFYHPLTPVDMTAFDEMAMGEEVCEFIEGTICVKSQDAKSQDESPISQGTKKEDKKKEVK